MRRITLAVGLAMLFALVAAGAALAVTKTCATVPCNGTENEDTLYEREGTVRDVIYGFGEEDVIDANTFNFDEDRVFGGDRGDKLLVNDGDSRDLVKGGAGRDVCFIDPGDRAVNCEVTRDDQGSEGTSVMGDVGPSFYE
ncbi:MAG: hypothetical protein M3151_07040 [Actinomycetota bacterium]|nr:hypothetical protein [Actinomycetota bacterium]